MEEAQGDGTVITCNGLRKVYSGGWFGQDVEALQGLDLAVPEGHIYGLLGPNGAGKTTFVKCLLGLVRINSGTAFLWDERVPNNRLNRRIGYLPEDYQLPEHLTGMKALEYFGKLNSVPPATSRSLGEKYLEQLDMIEWKDRKIRSYSKGMKQRLALVQALVNDPDLLFLDEPTHGVDPVGRKIIRDLLEELQAEEDMSIFINSHILTELELICDRVAILDKGELRKEGAIDELTEGPIQYEIITAREFSPRAREEISERWEECTFDDNTLLLSLEKEQELDELQALLQDHAIPIRSMTSREQSLEDVFLETVTTEEYEV